MNEQPWGLYVLQLLQYFVEQQHYQVVTIRQNRKELWLMNAQNKDYPILLLSHDSDAILMERQVYLRRVFQVISHMTNRSGKLVILNTNPTASEMTREFFTQVLIQPGECSDDSLKNAFPDIVTAVYEVENVEEEYTKITRSLAELQRAAMAERRKQTNDLKQLPKTSVAVIAFCVIIWLIALSVSNYLESDLLAALLCGAYYKMNIVSLHEFWRFVTAGFLHVDAIHLLCNMTALYVIGKACERSFSRIQYLVILTASIIMGNLFVFLTAGNMICLGISGGIFGLLGAFLVTLFANGSIRHPMVKASVFRLLLINLMISLLPGISLFSHLGGFVCGIFLGIVFADSERWKNLRVHVAICFAILVAASGMMAMKVNWVEPLSKETDRSYLAMVRNLGWESYAQRIQKAYLHYYSKTDLGLPEGK